VGRRRDRRKKAKVRGFLGAFLSGRDWVYLLSLLLPFVVYDLALKASDVGSQAGELALNLGLMRSDILFDLGYVLLWIGLFAVARRGPLRWVVVFLFHAVTVLVVVVSTCAHQYYQETGTTLDYDTIAEWIPKFNEIEPILFGGGVALSAWVVLFFAFLYAIIGPWLITRAVERWRGWPERRTGTAGASVLGSVGLCLLALGFGSLSPLVASNSAGANTSLARDPFMNVVLTGVNQMSTKEDYSNADPSADTSAANASLAPSLQTQKRNVVLIHLESTRAESVTPYNENLKTTPFLDELAKSSLMAERAYVVVPRTSKATVAVNCGVNPPLFPGPEFAPGGIPARCLTDLLKEQGYRTVFFQSSSETGDRYQDIVSNVGYDEYYPEEAMDTTGFQWTSYFGYEDDIMLKPSGEWLREHQDKPFMAEYMTGTGHHDYQCIPNRYGTQNFSDDDQLNHYLNCLHYLDHFVENLIEQYKEAGLYDNTIFVVYGDHGEGFGEHGRYQHGDTIWEEGLRIPLLIHAPGLTDGGERVGGLVNETDVVPTVLEMLGYNVQNGQYPGYSLLHPVPENRTLNFSCYTNYKCLASLQGDEKYIYHYGNQPDEVFDLYKDPLEKHNLADQYNKEDLDNRREALLRWRLNVNAAYDENLATPP
jgi:phosphoglycerol transferase MdoB-like AlkP superfamily enzyme